MDLNRIARKDLTNRFKTFYFTFKISFMMENSVTTMKSPKKLDERRNSPDEIGLAY